MEKMLKTVNAYEIKEEGWDCQQWIEKGFGKKHRKSRMQKIIGIG